MKEILITGIDAIAYVAAAMNSDILYKTSCLIYKYLLLRTLFYPPQPSTHNLQIGKSHTKIS